MITKKQEEILEKLEGTACNISVSCKSCGISRQNFYEWYAENEDFREAVDETKESIIDFAESMLMNNIRNGEQKAIEFFLTTRARHRGWVKYQNLPGDFGLKRPESEKQIEIADEE